MSTFEEETSHTNIAKTGSFVSYLQNSDKVQDSCRKQSLLVKQNSRNDIVTKTLMSQSKVLSCVESCLHTLPRGSFLIMRVLWDKNGEKFHDHLCCVDWVCGYQIKLIFITDIYEPLSRSRTNVWDIQDLNLEAKRGNLRFIKFSLGSFGDEVDIVLERARNYEVPPTGVELLHFLRTCAFGLKEPIYSKEQLCLCEDASVLMIRTNLEDKIVFLVRAKNDKFHMVIDEKIGEVILNYEELDNITGTRTRAIYYYPDIRVDKIKRIPKITPGLGHQIVHNAVEVGGIHIAEKGVKHAVANYGMKLIAPELAGAASHAFGGALHGVLASIAAGFATNDARNKEKAFNESGGLDGFTRTKGNKEVTAAWTSAAVGTGASVVGSMGTAALLGQVAVPIPGVGLACGAVAGGVIAGIAASVATKKASNKIFGFNIEGKCPLGGCF